MHKLYKRISFGLLIGFIVILASLFVDNFSILESSVYDFHFTIRGVKSTPSPIVILDIDKNSINTDTNFFYASIINKLKENKAGVIALIRPLRQYTSGVVDKKLADSITKAGNVILADYLKQSQDMNYPQVFPLFSKTSLNGYLDYPLDKDGAARTFSVISNSQEQKENFSFAIQVINKYNKQYADSIVKNYGNKMFFINYSGPEANFNHISSSDLLSKSVLNMDLANKIVIINDIEPKVLLTSFGKMSEAGIQASIIDTVLRNIPVKKLPFIVNALFILLSSVFTGILILYWGHILGLVTFISITAFYIVINIFSFTYLRLYSDIMGVLTAGFFIYVVFFIHRLSVLTRKLMKLRNGLNKLPPQAVNEILKNTQISPHAKGERRVVSVLFSDITDFTSMSEKLPTDEVVKLLNEYLTVMTEIIIRNNGIVDKYMGDRIMAVFGSHSNSNAVEDAYQSIKTALEMESALKKLQQKWLSEGIRPFQIRTGINTGEALIGYIGCPQQIDFTVIGDTVNTASRLEELNKDYQTTMIISSATYDYVKDYIKVKYLGPVKIKGKKDPVMVYELITWKIPPISTQNLKLN